MNTHFSRLITLTYSVNPGDPAALTIKVVSAMTGESLEAISLGYTGYQPGTVSTDASGEAVINTFDNGEAITISVVEDGYDDAELIVRQLTK